MGECTYPNVNHGSSIIRAGRVFIYFPFKSFSQTHSLFLFWVEEEPSWIESAFPTLSGRPPSQTHGPEQTAGPFGMVWVKILGLWVSFVVGILLIKLGVNLYIFLCAFSLMADICLFCNV